MITLNASGSSITFTFDGNSTYLNDGTITVPVNSLALIIDESDMISFKKANSNDIFVSANIAEFGMTKDELIAWYKENMVGSTGGGKAIEAGRGISVTTGETADTVSFNLPISAGTGTNSIAEGNRTTASGESSHAEGQWSSASGRYSHAEGEESKASGYASHAEGDYTLASGYQSHAEGYSTKAIGDSSHAEGYSTSASGYYSHAEGYYTIANNISEHTSGEYNVSNTGESTSAQTLFSVGNGGYDETVQDYVRHNAFEIRKNGDIYFFDGTNDVKLQDVISNILNRLTTIENNS